MREREREGERERGRERERERERGGNPVFNKTASFPEKEMFIFI